MGLGLEGVTNSKTMSLERRGLKNPVRVRVGVRASASRTFIKNKIVLLPLFFHNFVCRFVLSSRIIFRDSLSRRYNL